MRKTVQACVVVAACGFPAAVLGVSQPRLIADLATVPSPQEGSVPAEFVQVGAYLLFTARPDDHARRLWRSDGTAAGTQELANACGPLEEGGFALRYATPAREPELRAEPPLKPNQPTHSRPVPITANERS